VILGEPPTPLDPGDINSIDYIFSYLLADGLSYDIMCNIRLKC